MTGAMEDKFVEQYLLRYRRLLTAPGLSAGLLAFRDLCLRVRSTGNKLIFAGNGASASISSHAATDFTQHAGVRSVSFNDHNLITAFANDYGYENWLARALEAYADPGDVVVLTSSSGKSPNVLHAARYAVENGLDTVTFSGFSCDNPLRGMGQPALWVDSCDYNVVESVHLAWILSVANLLDPEKEGSVSLEGYFGEHLDTLSHPVHSPGVIAFYRTCRAVSLRGGKMIFAGNGGSASIASHAATDFTKQSRIRSVCFNDHNLITAFANDYGQQLWVARCIEAYADPKDAVVLISSSGRSANMVEAARVARQKGLPVVTFTAFDPDNTLRAMGDTNLWVDSHSYNVAEAVHSMLVFCAGDLLAAEFA